MREQHACFFNISNELDKTICSKCFRLLDITHIDKICCNIVNAGYANILYEADLSLLKSANIKVEERGKEDNTKFYARLPFILLLNQSLLKEELSLIDLNSVFGWKNNTVHWTQYYTQSNKKGLLIHLQKRFSRINGYEEKVLNIFKEKLKNNENIWLALKELLIE